MYSLHVYNLNFQTSLESFEKKFKEFGNVIDAKLIVDKDGFSKGRGKVLYSNEKDAESAIKALTDNEFEGRQLYFKIKKIETQDSKKDQETKTEQTEQKQQTEQKLQPERTSSNAAITTSPSQGSFYNNSRGSNKRYDDYDRNHSRMNGYGEQRPYSHYEVRYHQRRYN